MPRKTVFPDADSDNGSEEENLFGQKDFNKSDLDDSSEEDENENRDFEEGNSGVMDEENSSDDDDVPLEVSKAASKKAANERFANIIEALKTSKAKKKEKRKDRQKLYEKQKEEKRTKLVQALPEGILDGVEKIVESAKLQNQTDQKLPDKDYDELKEEGIKEIDLEEETIDQPKKIQAVLIEKVADKAKSSIESASEFRNKRLYNSGINRLKSTSNSYFS